MKRGSRHNQTRTFAFTLIEVLVVVAIIALLISILLPSLSRARDQAKEVTCGTNLSAFGRGFYAYAAANKDFMCSGSFDPGARRPITTPTRDGRDGPVDKVGWVADLKNSKTAFPATMLCPTSPARFNQKVAYGTGYAYLTAAESDTLVAHGYNTNYTQTWYMARTECARPTASTKDVTDAVGPLRTARLIRVSASRVPILGDGSLEKTDTVHGEITCRTMTDGPHAGPYGIQDYSDIGPQHGFGPTIKMPTGTGKVTSTDRIRANVMFADGHLDRFTDRGPVQADGTPRDGRFGLNTDGDPPVQDDLEQARVFDGIISLGRRNLSNDSWVLE